MLWGKRGDGAGLGGEGCWVGKRGCVCEEAGCVHVHTGHSMKLVVHLGPTEKVIFQQKLGEEGAKQGLGENIPDGGNS